MLVPFAHSRGQVPSKIEIERKRRQYQQQDTIELLNLAGVDISSLENTIDNTLPIDIFDDTSFDCRTPQEWMALGIHDDGTFAFVPAKGFRWDPITSDWGFEPCRVVDWIEDTNQLRVIWGMQPREQEDATWLPRLHVQFLAEDPQIFVRRISYACKQRSKALAVLRYKLFVDSMPTDGMCTIDAETIERIKACGMRVAFKNVDITAKVASLISEMRLDWCRAMNKMMLERQFEKDEIEVCENGVLAWLLPNATTRARSYFGQNNSPAHKQ